MDKCLLSHSHKKQEKRPPFSIVLCIGCRDPEKRFPGTQSFTSNCRRRTNGRKMLHFKTSSISLILSLEKRGEKDRKKRENSLQTYLSPLFPSIPEEEKWVKPWKKYAGNGNVKESGRFFLRILVCDFYFSVLHGTREQPCYQV
ncbi:hypothetical protein TNCT_716661 [Trichonephila clavata]|uniref:Uncharacterized protein n=1 Tax=Trichonephila clavata TaxID=2740835 RepID=A0A8X6J1F1_TRICU|nr:hypothetical protein TNCT_716661 [Trichonephila clavata]